MNLFNKAQRKTSVVNFSSDAPNVLHLDPVPSPSQRSSIGSFKNLFQRSSTYPSQLGGGKSSLSSLDEVDANGAKSDSDKSSTTSSSEASTSSDEEEGAVGASRKSHLAPLPPRRPTFEMHRQSLEREINGQRGSTSASDEQSKKEMAPILDPVKITPMSLASCSYAVLAPAVCMAMFVFLVMFLLVLIVDSSTADPMVVEGGTNSSDGNFMGG